MPLDCKQNNGQCPPYDKFSYAYRNRRDIECKPSHLILCFNAGYKIRPTTQMGIMALESSNNTLGLYILYMYYYLFLYYLYINYILIIYKYKCRSSKL